MIRVGKERLSPLQAALILQLREGPESLAELYNYFRSNAPVPKSSFYSALYELERRGIIARRQRAGYTAVELTRRGEYIAEELPSRLRIELAPIIGVLRLIAKKMLSTGKAHQLYSLADEIEDPGLLERYKEFMLKELEKVERRLEGWRRVRVE